MSIRQRRFGIAAKETIATLPLPVIVSTGASGGSVYVPSTGSLPIGVPSGVVSGSLVVVGIATEGTPTIGVPSGFVAGPTAVLADSQYSTNFTLSFFYKYATASDTGTYAFTTLTGATPSQGSNGYAMRITGPTSGSPFVDTLHTAVETTVGRSVTLPTFTPGAANSLLLGIVQSDNLGAIGVPSGWTLNGSSSDSDGNETGIVSLGQTTVAATGALAFTSSANSITVVAMATLR